MKTLFLLSMLATANAFAVNVLEYPAVDINVIRLSNECTVASDDVGKITEHTVICDGELALKIESANTNAGDAAAVSAIRTILKRNFYVEKSGLRFLRWKSFYR